MMSDVALDPATRVNTGRTVRGLVLTIALTWIGGAALAADVTVTRRVTLKGAPGATWALVGDYCGIANWDPGVARCEITVGTNNRPGAVRLLTLTDASTVAEDLVAYDAALQTYTYRILKSSLPVASYTAMISVFAAAGGGSIVEWTSTFAASPGSDEVVLRQTIEQIFDAGPAGIRAKDAGQ